MIKYSVVIPTYGRPEHLKECLASINAQTVKPKDVLIIDNNGDAKSQKMVKKAVASYSAQKINFIYYKGLLNSGAVARNYGASLVTSELVAFLDDDVVVDSDYYENILDVFASDSQVVGVQGLDRALVESFKDNVRGRLFGHFWLALENFFESGSIYRDKNSILRPSLAVSHPIPDVDFCVKSEWISTCAGVFKTSLFKVIEFPNIFVKYSWNEYVFFSYSIYKNKLGTMVYTSDAKYRNIPTDDGRMPLKELLYMAEVYDFYIFSKLFNRNVSDRLIYLKSRVGRLIYYFSRMLFRKELNFSLVSNVCGAFYFAFSNRKEIRNGNFEAYNRKFPIE